MDVTGSRMSASARTSRRIRACGRRTIFICPTGGVAGGSVIPAATCRVIDGNLRAVLQLIEPVHRDYFPRVYALNGCCIAIGGAYGDSAQSSRIVRADHVNEGSLCIPL